MGKLIFYEINDCNYAQWCQRSSEYFVMEIYRQNDSNGSSVSMNISQSQFQIFFNSLKWIKFLDYKTFCKWQSKLVQHSKCSNYSQHKDLFHLINILCLIRANVLYMNGYTYILYAHKSYALERISTWTI